MLTSSAIIAIPNFVIPGLFEDDNDYKDSAFPLQRMNFWCWHHHFYFVRRTTYHMNGI